MHDVRALAVAALTAAMLAGCDGRAHPAGSITIDRPAAEVFPLIAESARRKEWVGGVRAISEVTVGGPRVGSKVVETLDMGGKNTRVQAEVVRLEPGKLLAVKGDADDFDVFITYRLEETGGRTRVSWDAEFRFKPVLGKLLIGVIAPDLQQKMEADFLRLKALAERREESRARGT